MREDEVRGERKREITFKRPAAGLTEEEAGRAVRLGAEMGRQQVLGLDTLLHRAQMARAVGARSLSQGAKEGIEDLADRFGTHPFDEKAIEPKNSRTKNINMFVGNKE